MKTPRLLVLSLGLVFAAVARADEPATVALAPDSALLLSADQLEQLAAPIASG